MLLGIAEQDPDAVQLSKEQQQEVAHRLREPAVYATDEQVAELVVFVACQNPVQDLGRFTPFQSPLFSCRW